MIKNLLFLKLMLTIMIQNLYFQIFGQELSNRLCPVGLADFLFCFNGEIHFFITFFFELMLNFFKLINPHYDNCFIPLILESFIFL